MQRPIIFLSGGLRARGSLLPHDLDPDDIPVYSSQMIFIRFITSHEVQGIPSGLDGILDQES